MSLAPIDLRTLNLDTTDLLANSGDFNNALTVGGIPVSLSGHDDIGSGNFSTSLAIPSGSALRSFSFSGIGNDFSYKEVPQVVGTMRFSSEADFFYGYSTYNVTKTGFAIAFSDVISETGHFLDLIVNKDPE